MNTSTKKQTLLLILSIFFCTNAMAQFAGGTGTKKNPFQIETAQHLNNVRGYLGEQYYFVLQNDINLETYLDKGGDGWNLWGDEGWLPIGNDTTPFEGKFYGNSHTILGLWIDRPESNYAALFGAIGDSGAILSLHVVIEPTAFVSGNNKVGGICGSLKGSIKNCSSSGTFYCNTIAGAMVGYVFGNGCIEKSYASGEVFCNNYGGGFVGYICDDAIIVNCFSHTNVNQPLTTSGTGGFIGRNFYASISNCYSTGYVKYDGVIQTNKGFAGMADTDISSEITGCFWDTETSGASSSAGEATGKTTAEMTTGAHTYPNVYTLEGWDFKGAYNEDVWNIGNGRNAGYPYFNWQYPDDPPFALFAGGDGSESNPFQITCAHHLDNVRNYLGASHSDKHFILMNDINLSDYLEEGGDGYAKWETLGWLPIGGIEIENRFNGSFYGDGNKITGLWINRPDNDCIAFWGVLGEDGTIMELGIEVDETHSIIGKSVTSIFTAYNFGNILKCFSKGIVEGYSGVGNFVGHNSGTIEQSFSTGEVYGDLIYVGGFAGYNYYGTIENCFSIANVTTTINPATTNNNGAFNGKNFRGTINNCYSTGWIKYNTTILTDRGFCGSVDTGDSYEMTGNFWDTQTAGATSTAGEATGKTTAEMTTYSTFYSAGWDFLDESTNGNNDYWSINSEDNGGYPFLSWQGYNHDPREIPENLQVLNLIIPNGETDCFNAFDTITVAGTDPVVIQSGASANFIAGQSIRFLPGFHAHAGSTVNAWISTTGDFCETLVVESTILATQPLVEKSIEINGNEKEEKNIVQQGIVVYPNPNNGQFTIRLNNINSETRVLVFNTMGQSVYDADISEQQHAVVLPGIQRGLYFIKAINNKKQFNQKIVIQ